MGIERGRKEYPFFVSSLYREGKYETDVRQVILDARWRLTVSNDGDGYVNVPESQFDEKGRDL
ncbi:hypothetical protein [Paenibacillus polymyxa]|uniref:hypothetical protein n=1 Tax=Paenibacillus polymyxa TaxID=1406 RepID=UPI00234A0673|nr:hypothetical protein [Paenibacillus polymyxa]WCM62877.1 hypothetical protein OYT09_08070 [Paenibacillus polymyxa]